MCASKIGSWAPAGAAHASRTATATPSAPRFMAAILSLPGRPARPARPVPDLDGVVDRREHDAIGLRDALLVRAAVPAHDVRGGAADERRRAALELQQPRLEGAAEGVVTPRPVAPHDPVAGQEDRH